MRLSKSDFKTARDCPAKLYYKKKRYPSTNDDNPYLSFLADGGYMVEAMAKLLFSGGVEMESWHKPVEAFEDAAERVLGGDCTLFEPTILHNHFLARVDILVNLVDSGLSESRDSRLIQTINLPTLRRRHLPRH